MKSVQRIYLEDFIDQIENFVMDSWVNFEGANKEKKLIPVMSKKELVMVKGFFNFLMAQLEEAKILNKENNE